MNQGIVFDHPDVYQSGKVMAQIHISYGVFHMIIKMNSEGATASYEIPTTLVVRTLNIQKFWFLEMTEVEAMMKISASDPTGHEPNIGDFN
jgi:hypothetical protein